MTLVSICLQLPRVDFKSKKSLRGPITDMLIFPQDEDPKTAPITMEELKKLVRLAGTYTMHASQPGRTFMGG